MQFLEHDPPLTAGALPLMVEPMSPYKLQSAAEQDTYQAETDALRRIGVIERGRVGGGLDCDFDAGEPGAIKLLSPIFVVAKETFTPPHALRAAFDAYDMRAICASALASGARIGEAAMQSAANRERVSYEGFAAAELSAARGDLKLRMVLDLSASGLNKAQRKWPHNYPSVLGEFADTWEATDIMVVDDLMKGYYAGRLKRSARGYMAWRDPIDSNIFYRFMRYVMGSRPMGPLFSVITGMLVRRVRWVCAEQSLRAAAMMYIDDLLARAQAEERERLKAIIASVAAEARVTFSPTKHQEGATVTALGLDLTSNRDGHGPIARVAPKHLFRFFRSIGVLLSMRVSAAAHKARVSTEFLAKLAGRGQFLATVTPAVKLRLGVLSYASMRYSPKRMLRIGDDVMPGLGAALNWFVNIGANGGLRAERRIGRVARSRENVVHVFGDAGRHAAAAVWRLRGIYRRFNANDERRSSTAREFDAPVGMTDLCGHEWRDKLVVYHFDNLGCTYIINTMRVPDATLRSMVTAIFDRAAQHGFDVMSVWIPRERNTVQDARAGALSLAQAQFEAAQRADAHISVEEYSLPADARPVARTR